MANDLIRMSGMNSGLDTESIINALTANTKLKATKQERNVLKYEATQEAYRDIITKMNALKDKYFNLLNKDENLGGTSMWNKYTSATYVGGEEKALAGMSVMTSVNSQPGEYKMTVKTNAKQAKMTGSSLSSKASFEGRALKNLDPEQEYGFSITVDGETKNLTFTAGNDVETTVHNINDALEKAFGESNSSVGDDGVEGMVYIPTDGLDLSDPDSLTFSLRSRDGKGIALSGLGAMDTTGSLDLTKAENGTNTLAFQVGDEVLNVEFSTISTDYFQKYVDAGFIKSDGTTAEWGSEEWETAITQLAEDSFGEEAYTAEDLEARKTELTSETLAAKDLYEQVASDYKESVQYEAFKTWKETAPEDQLNILYSSAEQEHREETLTKWFESDAQISSAYTTYKGNLASGETPDDIYTWATTGGAYTEWHPDKINDLIAKYDGTNHDDQYYTDGYASYESSFNEESGETKKTFDQWKADKIESDSYHLNKSAVLDNERKLFEQYMKNEATVNPDEANKADRFDFSNDNIYKHFTETALNNSINKLAAKDGTKFSATLNSDGTVSIESYKETTDENGDTVRTAGTAFSVTAVKGSKNNLGVSEASRAISQIANDTKLSELNLTPGSNGKYSFTINGKTLTFDEDTTVNDMMKTVNGTAGVKMTYSSLDNRFTMTNNTYGITSEIKISDDPQGLLSALGLGDEAESYERGTNLKVQFGDDENNVFESAGNSITADGTTFTFTKDIEVGKEFTVEVKKDTSAIADVIKNFVADYNKLIEDVYKYLDEKPEKDYYFLTDSDKEDLDLSEKQEEKWEEKSKKGLLYHDSVVTRVMSNLRTSLMGTVTSFSGEAFNLTSIGIQTESDYNKHGAFGKIDEKKLTAAIENNSEDILKLFTDSENGIMNKFSEALDGAVKATGDNKGALIRKAGLATGTSATDNELYRAIKQAKTRMASLNTRYENEQNRLWKKYSAMESMMGTLNSQQASISSYFM